MPLKLTCPSCKTAVPLNEPLPLPGSNLQCPKCTSMLAVTYPAGAMEQLKARGKTFMDEARAPRPSLPPRVSSKKTTEVDPADAKTEIDTAHAKTEINSPPPDHPPPRDAASYSEFEPRTVSAKAIERAKPSASKPTPPVATSPTIKPKSPPPKQPKAITPSVQQKRTPKVPTKQTGGPRSRLLAVVSGFSIMGIVAALLGIAILGAVTAGGGYYYYSQDLPSIEELKAYSPPTVTTVLDYKGELLGEIYKERRYVVPLEQVPEHTIHAFIAAEDANFYSHNGVDYIGIVRAMLKNISKGRMAQGASTITQQVTRTFLLTRDKKLERKIKEIILSWRIEEVYTKEHILYLYINQTYLGSGAYGVEAAARVYFGKHASELTVAESAMLAGLPQRPSDYSPHRHYSKALERQSYVLEQMEDKGFITSAERAEATHQEIIIAPRGNDFLTKSPHFTEYVRRHLVNTYGHERVYNEGLIVRTTCNLELQSLAQSAVTNGINRVDQRMGFRRDDIEHLDGDTAIESWRQSSDETVSKSWSLAKDPSGRAEVPEKTPLTVGEVYKAVVLAVDKRWARVAVGDAEMIIPTEWSKWVYVPNPKRSWRHRVQNDLTENVDSDGDGVKDGSILRVGDVVQVKVETDDTRAGPHKKVFRKTPGSNQSIWGARLWQTPEVEGALLSMDLKGGAVRAMVGGADFSSSELNRTIQSRRQVGSTFKPIVYAAAISSRKVTAATMVADAPLAYAANDQSVWKPANYAHDYLGNITVRKALAMSRNTCTIRLLDGFDPSMNNEIIYRFGRALGIGGPPTHTLPDDWVVSPKTDHLCPWVRELKTFSVCNNRTPPKDPDLTNTAHRAQMGDDVYWCRACDLTMALGSASLTMSELVRAYSTFGTGGKLVQPYFIEEVTDRTGTILEKHEAAESVQVMDPEVATIVNWLLQGVVNQGTAASARRLGLHNLGGKTGTTNDEKDAWFIGLTSDIITSVWVGFDQPRSLGVSSTGGRTALPIWMDYMEIAAPKSADRPFPRWGAVEWVGIDEETGRRVTGGGTLFPFIIGTAPENLGVEAGQYHLDDAATEL